MAGRTLTSVFHPRRTLKSMFGYNIAARDAADNFNMAPCRHSFALVMQTLNGWGKSLHAPSFSRLLRAMRMPVRKNINHNDLNLG